MLINELVLSCSAVAKCDVVNIASKSKETLRKDSGGIEGPPRIEYNGDKSAISGKYVMAHLSLSVLGAFQAALDGEPVTAFESDKVRALLAYLAVESEHPHRRETLAGLFWPERPERVARQNLSQALSNLRRAIGDRDATLPFLLITHQTLQFNRSSDHWLDATLFTDLLDVCAKHRHRRLAACGACMDRFQQAVALYRGGFLEGISLGDSLAFEEWSLLEGERFHRLLVEALSHLADCHEQRGEYEVAFQHLRQWVELDPWQEEAHRGLMRVLALDGQRSVALAQYEICRRTLSKELGIDPEEETTALCQRIRAGALLAAPLSAVPHNLPAPLTPFVGREAELAELTCLLTDPDIRLVTVLGAGGMGKTRLALEAAAAQKGHFSDGVYFVSLAPLQSVEAVVPTVAKALDFSSHEKGEPRQQLLDYVRQKSMLLILDNFEHLLSPNVPPSVSPEHDGDDGGGSLVIDILQTAPHVTILTTSRARLNVKGEQLFPIAGMDYPDVPPGPRPEDGRGGAKGFWPGGQSGQDAVQYGAVRLFLQSARRVHPGFELVADNLTHVARVCRLVQGMPLGILLAGAWAGMLTPAEIAAEIDRSLDFLETDARDVPAEGVPAGKLQRSIRAVFDHSWSLLTEREREVFQGLSVFHGGFTRQAAQTVTVASLRELRDLVNKSLLNRDAVGRYGLHELLRRYAAEKLAGSPAVGEAVHDRHSAYYTTALQRWAADLGGPQQQAALAEMDVEIDNARTAWDWAAERGQVERLEDAIDSLCRFYGWRGRCTEGEAACQFAAQKLAATASGGDGHRVWARTLAWQSDFSQELGRTELANQLLRQSLSLLEGPELASQDTRPEKAFVLMLMGWMAFGSDREQTRRLWEQSLALYRALDDRWGTATVLRALGSLAVNSSTYDEAKRLLAASLHIQRSLGHQRDIAASLGSLSVIAVARGQLEEGERLARECDAILQGVGERASIADGRLILGATLHWLGRFAEALPSLEESVAIYADLGSRDALTLSYATLANAKLHLGEYEAARDQAQVSLALSRETGNRRETGLSLLVLGGVALAEEAYAKAHGLLQESVAAYREIGQQMPMTFALAVLEIAAFRLGQPCQARQYLLEALRTMTEIGAVMPMMYALPATALLLADQGALERAVELYALASRHVFVASSRWFEDVAGQHISAVAARPGGLPPDVVTAAQARGQARDMEATVTELSVKPGRTVPEKQLSQGYYSGWPRCNAL